MAADHKGEIDILLARIGKEISAEESEKYQL
jgi:hypothetical protein